MTCVYLTRGMTVSIPQFSLRIGEDGSIDADPIVLHLRFDVCPTWVQVAKRHLDSALLARSQRQQAWASATEETKAALLEAEFEASMQAITAAAIAWDALYAVLRECKVIPDDLARTWRTRRTARYSQISETVRRAFSLKPRGTLALRNNLKEIYKYRDLAVHPPGKIQAAILHPEIGIGMEWRFVYFRARNAEFAVLAAAAMLWSLAHDAKPRDQKVIEYQKGLLARLEQIFPDGQPLVPTTEAG